MVMMILGGAIVKCAKWGLLKIKKKFEIELYVRILGQRDENIIILHSK
jgi:hypothetical protein